MYEEKEAELDRRDNLGALEEERDIAKARSAFYQQQARRYQSREVRAKTYNICELVLRLPEKKKDKLKPKWEGPFIIDKVLTGGAYRLHNAFDNRLEPNPWNASRLQRFYASCRTSVRLLTTPFSLCSSPFFHYRHFSFFTQIYSIQCGCSDRSDRTMCVSHTWGLPIRKLNIISFMASCLSHMRSFSICAFSSPLYASI